MNDKKIYWLLEDNADLSITCENLETCTDLIQNEIDNLDGDTQVGDVQFTLTPKFMTEEEYNNLPEA